MLYLGYVLLRYVLIYNLEVSFNFHLTFLQLNVIKMFTVQWKCFFFSLPAIFVELPITRTFFDFALRFELSGVDCTFLFCPTWHPVNKHTLLTRLLRASLKKKFKEAVKTNKNKTPKLVQIFEASRTQWGKFLLFPFNHCIKHQVQLYLTLAISLTFKVNLSFFLTLFKNDFSVL